MVGPTDSFLSLSYSILFNRLFKYRLFIILFKFQPLNP